MTASGLALGVHGIVGKEVRSRTRGWRPMLVLTVYLLILTATVVAVLGIAVSSSGTISPGLGQLLFAALAGGSVMLVAFISPALTAGAISGERATDPRPAARDARVAARTDRGQATGRCCG